MCTKQLTNLISEYGIIAMLVYLMTGLPVYVGFVLAGWFGADLTSVDSNTAQVATIGASLFAAWILLRATVPLRIGIAVVITPWVAKVVKRRRLS